jgi:hypothetical protein
MNKLPVYNKVRLLQAAASAVGYMHAVEARAPIRARPFNDLFTSIRVLNKTALFAIQVAEIVGFLALL